MRVKDDYDGAEPSGNSVAAMNLLRLAEFTGRADLRQSAERAVAAFAQRLDYAPVALPEMLCACERMLSGSHQVVVVGEPQAPATRSLLAAVDARFLPHTAVLLVDSPEAREFFAAMPALAAMPAVEGQAAAYVCRDGACQLPVSTPQALKELLEL